MCSFELNRGEVLALVGENGAGKSSLMKILSGIYTKDAGTIELEGEEVEIDSPQHAQQLGISIIHQEMNLMPHLTVAQNIYIGREPRTVGRSSTSASSTRQTDRAAHPPRDSTKARQASVEDLTVAKQQMVEIAKALSFDAKVLIMDEPTSALTDSETETLLHSHRGAEDPRHRRSSTSRTAWRSCKRIADRVTVLRDGHYIGDLEKSRDRDPEDHRDDGRPPHRRGHPAAGSGTRATMRSC